MAGYRFLAALTVSLASSAPAQEPPNYIGFIQQAERFAVATAAGGTCEGLGFAIDQRGLLQRMQDMIDEAELAGMPGGQADMLMAGAIEAESSRQQARSDAVDKSDPAAVDRLIDYWERRCASMAQDPVYGRYFGARANGK